MLLLLKKRSLLLSILLISSALYAAPEQGEVAAGHAEFNSVDANSVKITTSEKAIINYRKFNIGEGQSVEFIQPSSKSAVLNRVTGKNPSKILGKLSGNGRVFLVNPSGVYFGPNATVNAGSFLASTLNIRDEDFLKDKFDFYLEPGNENAKIVNEGSIASIPEGFVALFAPFIENRGSIIASAGKVILAAAERVTLDFTGDGLLQFTVDGELEKALIENFGQIESAGGVVSLTMRTARDAIKMVVNTDGITPANAIEEADGVIRLVSKSVITADHVALEATRVEAEGKIDVSRTQQKGGTVHILGDEIYLTGAEIAANGDTGGGEILIGGEYQGKGDVRTALYNVMDNTSTIYADAKIAGDGGRVIVWADETTLFVGKIYARGGPESGNGGFVETSGKINLGTQEGHVNTSAPQGKYGDWLLDPNTISITLRGWIRSLQVLLPTALLRQIYLFL